MNTAGVCGDNEGRWGLLIFSLVGGSHAKEIPLGAKVCQSGGGVKVKCLFAVL